MPANVAVAIELSDHERARLEAWTRRRTSAQALAQRARIVLLAAEGLRNTEIAGRVGVSRNTGDDVAVAVCRASPGWIAR
jgi:DNA-binding NarL/FixJ family response regulator